MIKIKRYGKKFGFWSRVKSLHTSLEAHTTGAYPGFRSMKRLRVLRLGVLYVRLETVIVSLMFLSGLAYRHATCKP